MALEFFEKIKGKIALNVDAFVTLLGDWKEKAL